MMFFQSPHISERALSAFLDGRLAMPARARVAQHLVACADCRAAEQELRALRSALGALPEVRAPRSFALREADVRATAAPRPGGLLVRARPLLSGVTALALFTFVALVSIDLLSGSSGTGGAKTAAGLPVARQENYADAAAPSIATKDITAQALNSDQSTTTAPGSAFAVTAGAPSPTAALGDIAQLTATVSAPAAPATGVATPTASSEAPPLSGLNPSATATNNTEEIEPTPTPQPTPPREPASSPAAPNEASVPAGPATAGKDAGRPVPTPTAQTTRTPAPVVTAASNAPQTGSNNDTRLHAAEAALAAVAIVSGGGLFFAWRRRA